MTAWSIESILSKHWVDILVRRGIARSMHITQELPLLRRFDCEKDCAGNVRAPRYWLCLVRKDSMGSRLAARLPRGAILRI
jgi:hypothetical protein